MTNISKITFRNNETGQYTRTTQKAPIYTDPFADRNAQMADSFRREQSKQEKRANLITMAAVGTFIAFAVMAISSVATHKVNKRVAEAQIKELESSGRKNVGSKLQNLVKRLQECAMKNESPDDKLIESIRKELATESLEMNTITEEIIKQVKDKKQIDEKLIKAFNSSIIEAMHNEPTAAQRELGFKTSSEIRQMYGDITKAKSFEELKMSKEMEEQLDKIVDNIKRAETYDEYLQEIENAIMFYGPPGTGKTTFVLALCKKLGVKPFIYDMGQLKGGFQGVTEANMNKASEIFLEDHKAALEKDPKHISIVFFDECDEIFQKPKGGNENSDSQVLTRFKRGFNEWKAEKGVYIFGNTNKSPEELESAMGDRLQSVYIPRPTSENLSDNFFEHYAKGGNKIADDLKKPTERSKKFFGILAREEHEPSYRMMQRVGWKGIKVPKNGEQLTLNDIIKNAISQKTELNFSDREIQELQALIA